MVCSGLQRPSVWCKLNVRKGLKQISAEPEKDFVKRGLMVRLHSVALERKRFENKGLRPLFSCAEKADLAGRILDGDKTDGLGDGQGAGGDLRANEQSKRSRLRRAQGHTTC